jgi:mono/diheme cytochrome c family protein
MRWRVVGVAVLLVGAVGAWMLLPPGALGFAGGPVVTMAAYQGPTPAGVPAQLQSADLVRRGEYLSEAADCVVCHTVEGGQRFAGGRAFSTPFGVLYSPNITPDRETGIGAWSDAEFISAVHRGIGRGGERLYPAFPYESYTLLVDEDVRAIKAYLFSLPAVHAAAPPNSLKFPFNQRWLMAFWSAFYNPDHRFRPLQGRSPEWNRGAYLAEALGHCGDCHTPRNLLQALNNRHKFEGTTIGGWHAYNITSDRDSGIGAFSDADLSRYLSIGHADGLGTASGPMGEVVDESLRHLAPNDVSALVVYLRSIPAMASSDLPSPKRTAASASPREGPVAAAYHPGKVVFEQACASCHSWSGTGLLTPFATLTGARAINDPSATNVAQIILSGTERHTATGEVFMPAFGEGYSDVEIAAVANYVTARFGAEASTITAPEVAKLRGL